MTVLRRVSLSTGITMAVAEAGPVDAPPVILLHGFPESHRTWAKLVPLLGDRFRLIMPDLRGFGQSDRPQEVEAYTMDTLVADLFALADALGVDRFALVGHDWGGAVAWAAALRGHPRIERLAIINSPHPWIFQKSLVEDASQRAASQYMNAFRTPGARMASVNGSSGSRSRCASPSTSSTARSSAPASIGMEAPASSCKSA